MFVSPRLCVPLPKVVASEVERLLRERVAAGEWSACDRLPAERDLAAEYGVARNTVRRALGALADDGIIERHIGSGTFLNSAINEFTAVLRSVIGASPADFMSVRLILEPHAAALAAKNASPSDLRRIGEAHYHASTALQPNEFEHWDSQMHQRLFVATGNELLVSINDMLKDVLSRRALIELKRRKFSKSHRQDFCEQHADIVAALERRNPDAAAEAMLRHMKAIEIALFGGRVSQR